MPAPALRPILPPIAPPAPALLRPRDAAAHLGMGRSTFDRRRALGEVPDPVRIGGTLIAWSVAELDAWSRHGCPPRDEWRPIWKAILDAEAAPPARRGR